MCDIGEKATININGNNRIPDGMNADALSEVKNVGRLSYTKQLRDFADFARQTGRRFDLYTRSDTKISGPLEEAIISGRINKVNIP